MDLSRRLAAEAIGTAFLLAAVVGSGIMGERLAAGNVAIALLANSIATGCALVALILALGPVSGAHFNPAVTLAMAIDKALPWREAAAYVAVQVGAAFAGVAGAHLMFDELPFSASVRARTGAGQWWSELVATFGLIVIITVCSRVRPALVAFAVGCYIAAAYWFTASTSFANPAVTLARAASDTFAGIRGADAPAFILAQMAGAVAAVRISQFLLEPWCRSPGSTGPGERGTDRHETVTRPK